MEVKRHLPEVSNNMAIEVFYGPSAIDYGTAVAQATKAKEEEERQEKYANLLSRLQAQQQAYELGKGGLGADWARIQLQQQQIPFQQQELNLKNIMADLERQRLQAEINRSIMSMYQM